LLATVTLIFIVSFVGTGGTFVRIFNVR